MTYKPTTLQKVLTYFDWNERLGVTELSRRSGLGRAILHRYVKVLVEQWDLLRISNGAHTKYQLTIPVTKVSIPKGEIYDNFKDKHLLDEIFLKFTPRGSELTWYDGLAQRCTKRNMDVGKKAEAYITIHDHIQWLRNTCGLLDATQAFDQHVSQLHLDMVLYADQYKRMDFGRWKLAELTFFAKQSQSRKLLRRSIDIYIDSLICYIHTHQIDALAFVPWSITREQQLLKMLDAALYQIDLPRIRIKKYYQWETKVPQKSLKKREDRIENARETIYVRDEKTDQYETVLLIDDFVGSGSTLNETAKKLKKEGVQTVIWFAIVGNLDLSYDVINEV